MAVINALSEELYPVGTDIVTKYIGRDAEGYANFTEGKTINSNTGEYIDGNNAASDVYIPISPYYTYQKSANRLYNGTWYDENHNRISSFNLNNLQVQLLPKAPDNARYFRFASHPTAKANWQITITRIPVTSHSLQEARRRILLNTPHLETISDSIASFKTDVPALVKDCKVYFEPVQEGSGDPSPDNVRPITGWDGVTVYKSKRNLLITDGITFTGSSYINKDGNITSSRYYKRSNPIPCSHIAGKTVTFNTLVENGGSSVTSVAFYSSDIIDSDHAVLCTYKKLTSEETITATIPLTAKYMVITLNNTYTLDGKYIVEGTEPPNEVDTPTVITIPFPQTIYGGYVDLVKGEVVETWSKLVPTTVNTTVRSSSSGKYPYYMRTTLPGNGTVIRALSNVMKKLTASQFGTYDQGLIDPNGTYVMYWVHPDCATQEGANSLRTNDAIYFVFNRRTYITHSLADGLNHVTLGQNISPMLNGRSSTGGYVNSTATGIDGCKFVYFELGWPTEEFLQYSADISRQSEFVSDSRVLINGTTTDAKLGEMVVSTGSATDYEGDALVYLYVSVPSDCTDLESKRAYLAEHPVKITYPKKTPIPYTVDLTDLKPVKGTNNVWTDSNGNVEVKFWKH